MLEAVFLDMDKRSIEVHREKRSSNRTFTFEYLTKKVKQLGIKSCTVNLYFDGVLVNSLYL